MGVPQITGVDLGGPPEAALLVVGPSLGTSVEALWGAAATRLTPRLRVLGWELPGHGRSGSAAAQPFSMTELAAGVLAMVDAAAPGATFHYAGDSVGGCVGLQLALDAPHRIATATLVCTGAKIGTAESWDERAGIVRSGGTATMVEGSTQRWFAAGFFDRHPDVGNALLQALRHTDAEGYAQTCHALAHFDARARLADITAPVLAVAGREDIATPPELLAHIAFDVAHGTLSVLDQVGHLAPAEAPDPVAELILAHTGCRSERSD